MARPLRLSDALQRFMERTPVTVMTRAVIENSLSAGFVDRVFENSAQRQYSRELLFSSVVELLAQVVFREKRSVHDAYLWWTEANTSIASVYNKLNGTETCVSEELVRQSAVRMSVLVENCRLRKEPVPGLKLKFIDGNYLAQTDHRIFQLHGLGVAALPGQTLVMYEHATGLIRQICCCEDAHQQERSIVPGLYDRIEKDQLTTGDTGFCMNPFIQAHEDRKAFYLVRYHGGTTLEELGKRNARGRCSTGELFETDAILSKEKNAPRVRAIIIERDTPMANGEKTLILLTNVPRKKASAKKLAELYRARWTIEEVFRRLTQNLRCEVSTLGYPKAALLAFAIAVLAYNSIAVADAAIEKAHGPEQAAKLSIHAMAAEIASVGSGLTIATDPEDWVPFITMSPKALASFLVEAANHLDWRRFTKSPRGPKKPVTYRRFANGTHLATARVIAPQQPKSKKAASAKKRPP